MEVDIKSSGSATLLTELGLTVEQAARLLKMARSGGAKCSKEGPKRPEYQELVSLGFARMASYSNPSVTRHWLAADIPTVEKLREWQEVLGGVELAELNSAFAMLEEETNNAFRVQNGFPEKQTYLFARRPPEAPVPEGEINCARCSARFVPGNSASPEQCAKCAPIPLPPAPLVAGQQTALF